jgi:N-acyl-D-aspartate/D-glutamate deacylase
MTQDRADLLVRGGTVVDGTGAPAIIADVRVRAGRIAEVGPDLAPEGEEVLDATGALVTPGFLDLHTHLDPQVFFDPACDPQPQHGVTTALVGNCSLSLFPVTDEQRDAIADMFAFVEDVPSAVLTDSVPWTWTDYAGYRDAVTAAGLGLNFAALVGHSPLRLVVMGDAAWEREATPDEITRMAEMLDAAMEAGAFGLSTSFFDEDRRGRKVPSRIAGRDEFEALIDVVGRRGHGFVEFVPDLTGADPRAGMQLLADLCGPRNVPLTWTGFTVANSPSTMTEDWLTYTRELQAQGVNFIPQLSPRTVDFRLNWDSSMMFMPFVEGWHRVIQARGTEAKAALLADPEWRDAARAEWDTIEKAMFPNTRIEQVRIVEVTNPGDEVWLGKSFADLVADRGGHPSDVLADFALANDCRPGIVAVGLANSDVDAIARTMPDPNVIISSSDAGAHVQMLCASGDTTLLLTRHVRDRDDLTIERAVHELTGRQADLFGFRDRGVIEPGRAADLVVFALDELHYDDEEMVADLPGGALRFRRPEGGYRATIVNGRVVQRDGKLTGELPGRVLAVND